MSGYWYLATPYTKYPKGHQAAADDACKIAAALMKRGIIIFCPIAHSHSIALHGLDNVDAAMWEAFDKPLLDACCGVIVAEMYGWKESYGVQHEISEAVKAGKPVMYLPVDDLLES